MKIIILLLLLISLVALIHAYFNHKRLNSKYCIFIQNLQLILLPVAIYEVFSAPTISRNSLGEQEQLFSTGYYMILVIFIFFSISDTSASSVDFCSRQATKGICER